MLAKIEFRRRFKTESAVTQTHLVRVHGENLRLREAALDLNRQQNLLELSPEALFGRQEEHPAELLGQSACSLRLAPLEQVRRSRPENADDVHSPVVLEMAILDGKDGVLEHLGDLAVGDDHAAFEREAPDHGAVVGIKLRHHVRAIVFQLLNAREVRRVNKYQPSQRPETGGKQHQDQIDELAENPPTAREERRMLVTRRR